MLLYNKVIDPYHSLLRMLAICHSSNVNMIEYERLRMYDFLLAFPSHITDTTLPRNLTRQKNLFKKYLNTYNKFNARMSYQNMEFIQDAVIVKLESLLILNKNINTNEYKIQKEYISTELIGLIEESTSIDFELLKLISDGLSEIDLYGTSGLKDRLKILEFKYDAV